MPERWFLTFLADGDDPVPHVKSDPSPRIGRVAELLAAVQRFNEDATWADVDDLGEQGRQKIAAAMGSWNRLLALLGMEGSHDSDASETGQPGSKGNPR